MSGQPKAPEPLRVVAIDEQTASDAGVANAVVVQFNRYPTSSEIAAIAALPPSPKIAADLGEMVRRAMCFEIVVRLCRAYVLSPVLQSEGPRVIKFLRDYIDGREGIGPLGAPLPWPELLPETSAMLREWGFERSPNGWVARAGTYGAPAGTKPS